MLPDVLRQFIKTDLLAVVEGRGILWRGRAADTGRVGGAAQAAGDGDVAAADRATGVDCEVEGCQRSLEAGGGRGRTRDEATVEVELDELRGSPARQRAPRRLRKPLRRTLRLGMTCCARRGGHDEVSKSRLGRSARLVLSSLQSRNVVHSSASSRSAQVANERPVRTQLSAGMATNNTASTIAKIQVKPFVSTVVRIMRCTIGRECW